MNHSCVNCITALFLSSLKNLGTHKVGHNYDRTGNRVITEIKACVQHKNPRQVYAEMIHPSEKGSPKEKGDQGDAPCKNDGIKKLQPSEEFQASQQMDLMKKILEDFPDTSVGVDRTC